MKIIKQIILPCLMILLMDKKAVAFSITDIETLIEWGLKLYEIGNKYQKPSKLEENIGAILDRVHELSSQLDSLSTHVDIKLDSMLKTLLNDFQVEISLQNPKAKLSYYLNNIQHYYDNSQKYVYGKGFRKKTLSKFSESVLWGRDSLPNILVDIHDLFISGVHGDISPGFLSLVLQQAMVNLPHDCSKYVSTQQRMYYIYAQLILAEGKSLITLKQVYSTMITNSSYNFDAEMKDARASYDRRVKDYNELFKQYLGPFPRQLYQCHVNSPRRGIDFHEVQNFSRIILTSKKDNSLCVGCPHYSELDELSHKTNSKVYNCFNTGKSLTVCPAEPDTHRDYLWLKSDSNDYYGHSTTCNKETTINGGIMRGPHTFAFAMPVLCDVCICSAEMDVFQNDYNNNSTIWRISVTDQISDIYNDMVVTGVKFVTYKNAIHLQIKQANFSNNALVYNKNDWKQLNKHYNSYKVPEFKFESLNYNRKTIYLDEVKVPDTYAVTGVRFKLVEDSAFILQVHATPFEIETGKLNPSCSNWYDASTHPMIPDYYKRERMDIDMGLSDDPTRGAEFNYDLESNKMIRFIHTDIRKDAGQTTIPLLDGQPVETRPPFPLSGIGLSYRGRVGFGGYIAPRIFTINVSLYMNHVKNQDCEKNILQNFLNKKIIAV